jgi:DNA mismatch endonuclease (patch repair protein)
VFARCRVVVFCDGDFWHGRDLEERCRKLERGHNAVYWVAKIRRNVARDRQQMEALRRDGWKVIRIWEKDILSNVEKQAGIVERMLCSRESETG